VAPSLATPPATPAERANAPQPIGAVRPDSTKTPLPPELKKDYFVLEIIECHLAINGVKLVSGDEPLNWMAKATGKVKVLLELCIQSHQKKRPELYERNTRYLVDRKDVGHAVHAATSGRLQLLQHAQTVWRFSHPVYFDESVLSVVQKAFPKLDPALLAAACVAN
jgi:hypothetical protein